MRGADLLVAGLHVLLAPVVDHGVPEAHALGVEEGEAGALVVEAEEVEVAADAAVVALAGHLEGLEVGGQLLLFGEGGAVDAGELGVVLVAAPVGAGQAGELEGALAEAPGAGQVRPAAQVDELALGVDADGLLVGQVLDELDLEGLVLVLEEPERLVARQLGAGDRQVLGDDLGHLRLDARKVGVGDGLGEAEVVVEAVLDGRPDGVLGARPQALDRLGEHVRGAVAQDVDAGRRVEGDDGDLVALVELAAQVDGLAVDGGRDGGLGEARPDRLGGVERGRAIGEFERGAVGQGDVDGHGGTGPLCSRPRTLRGLLTGRF